MGMVANTVMGLSFPSRGACNADKSLCPEIGKLVALFGGVAFHFTGITLDQDAWNHIVLTRENGTLKLYKNGQLLFSKVVGNPNPPSAVDGYITIGTRPEYSFNGIVDEACIFDVALNESQVQAIYGAGSSGMCKAIKFTENYFLENGQFRLILKGKAGVVYRVEKSLNFSNWIPVTRQTNNTGTIEATDLNQSKAVRQFYRALRE
jgi:hypothetical protein